VSAKITQELPNGLAQMILDKLGKMDSNLDRIESRLSSVETQIGQKHFDSRPMWELAMAEILAARTESREEIAWLRAHVDERIGGLQIHLDEEISGLRVYIGEQIAQSREQTNEHSIQLETKFNLSAEDFMDLRGKVRRIEKAMDGPEPRSV
jgi:hypothetical protein